MICADTFELKNRNPTQVHCFQIPALLRWTCCPTWQPSADSLTTTVEGDPNHSVSFGANYWTQSQIKTTALTSHMQQNRVF